MQTQTATQPTATTIRNAIWYARESARRASGTVAERVVEDIKVRVVHFDDGRMGKDLFVLVNVNDSDDYRVIVGDFDLAVSVLASAFLWN